MHQGDAGARGHRERTGRIGELVGKVRGADQGQVVEGHDTANRGCGCVGQHVVAVGSRDGRGHDGGVVAGG